MQHPNDETKSIRAEHSEILHLADRFEAAFRAGQRPRIEEYFESFEGDRDQLLRELLPIELEYRKAAGETVGINDCFERFPDHESIVESFFLRGGERIGNDQPRSGHQVLPEDFGDFRLIRKIGEGGMGIVYEAEQKSLGNRRLAIKTVKLSGHLDERALKRFETEVQAVAQLEHRHIVPVYYVGEEAGIHFYVMKLIEGNNLRELIRTLRSAVRRREPVLGTVREVEPEVDNQEEVAEGSTHRSGWSKGDTLASNSVLDMISKDGTTAQPRFVQCFVEMGIQAAEALQYVHEQGIVHRDIKPANLLLDVDGDVWLTDFGLARIRDQPEMTVPGSLLGTYQYMSPEQAMGSKRVIIDHRTDIYSLGVTLYELLTLSRAFPGNTREEILRSIQFEHPPAVRKLSARVPVDLETIVMKAMAKDPNARFQSAAEMAAELKRFRDGKPLTIRRPSVMEKLSYWARVHREAAASIAVACLAVFLASVIFSLLLLAEQAETQAALQSETRQKQEVEKQKDKVTGLFEQSEGLRLAAHSLLQLSKDPPLALRLAMEAETRHPSADARDAIVHALDVGHHAGAWEGHRAPDGNGWRLSGRLGFNTDGSKLVGAVAANQGPTQLKQPAIVWDPNTGETLGKLDGEGPITSAVFSPDDALILTASGSQSFGMIPGLAALPADSPPQLWDATTYRQLVTFDDARLSFAHRNAFDSEGLKVVFPINGNQAAIYFCAGTRLRVLTGHTAPVVYAAFNPRGDNVVTYADDGTLRIWDADSGDERVAIAYREQADAVKQPAPSWIEFTPDGRRLVTGSATRGIEIWDLQNDGKRLNLNREPGSLGSIDRNGDFLLTFGGEDRKTMSRLAIRSAYDAHWIGELAVNRWLRKVVVSPDRRFAAVLYNDPTTSFQLWDLERRELVGTFDVGAEVIDDVVFSADSGSIATVSFNFAGARRTNIRLWHVDNGRQRATFPVNAGVGHPVTAVSPDGTTFSVVSNERDPVATLCDFSQASKVATLDGKIAIAGPTAERFLAIQKGRVAVHSVDDGRFLDKEAFFYGEATEFAINQDGDRVAVCRGDAEVLLWDPENDRRFLLFNGNSQVNSVRFTPDGKQLFALGSDGKVRVWNADEGNLERELKVGGRLVAIEFSPDAKRFAVASAQGIATLYDAATYEQIHRFVDEDEAFSRVEFSFDGTKLITYHPGQGRPVTVWDVESGDSLAKLQVSGRIGVAAHPSQPELLIWSSSEGAFLWRYDMDERVPVTERQTASGAYSSDGQSLYLADEAPGIFDQPNLERWPEETDPPSVTRWDRASLEPQESITLPLMGIHRVLVTDATVFVNAFECNQVVNFDFDSHRTVSTIPGHDGPVSQCLYSADGKRLITTSWDGKVSFWDVADGTRTLQWSHGSPIVAAAIHHDGNQLVTGARDGTCRLWNLGGNAEQPPQPIEVSLGDAAIWHLAFATDGNRILALSSDQQAHLFQAESGERIAFDFHAEQIEWAEFSPDGKSILVIPKVATGAEKQVVKVVPLEGDSVTELEYSSEVLTSHFHPTSERLVTATRDGMVRIQNIESTEIEQELSFDNRIIQIAVFDPSGESLYVREFNGGTLWRQDDDRRWIRWMTLDDVPVDHQWRSISTCFTPGSTGRVITRRVDTKQWRDWPLDPLERAKQLPIRQLSEGERLRFGIPAEPAELEPGEPEPVKSSNEEPRPMR